MKIEITRLCRSVGMILGLSVFCGTGVALAGQSRHPASGDHESSHGSQASHDSLKAPEITVAQLFTDVLVFPTYDDWKVMGKGLGKLTLWTREGKGKENRMALLVEAQKNEDAGNKILVHPMTKYPVKLTEETHQLFDEIPDGPDREIPWDGSFAGYEYNFDPKALHSKGDPISFYLVRKIPQEAGNGSERIATLAEIGQSYLKKGEEFRSRGLGNLAERFLYKGMLMQAVAGDAEAQFRVGQTLEKGEGYPQDFVKAAEWYERAAKSGNAQAHEALNRAGFKDFMHVWKNAHDKHSSHPIEAERALAKIYLTGNAWVAQDFQQASQWLKKHWSEHLNAAQHGNMEMQFALGVMYINGYEVHQDEAQAKVWLNKAIAQGHWAAHDFLENLNNLEKRINQKLAEFGIHVVYLPGGEFTMGTPDTPEERKLGRNDDEIAHRVKLSSFLVMDTKLTREQWHNITGEDPGLPPHEIENWTECPTCPMTYVNWDDAQKVIRKLGEKGIRAKLPTEAQQEYYLRLSYGSEKKVTETTYPWGTDPNQLSRYAWHYENSDGHVHPVGTTDIAMNSYGLKDALGNVWEWSDSWYGAYPKNKRSGFLGLFGAQIPFQDPQGPDHGAYRAARSCGRSGLAHHCRPADRQMWLPESRVRDVGFRLVMLP